MGLGPRTSPYQEIEVHTSCTSLSPCVGISFFVSDWMCTLFVSAESVWVRWQMANPTVASVLWEQGTGFLPLWHQKGVHRWTALHPATRRDSLARGNWQLPLKLILLCLLSVSKLLFHPVLDWIVFLANADKKMQWAEVCKVPPLDW